LPIYAHKNIDFCIIFVKFDNILTCFFINSVIINKKMKKIFNYENGLLALLSVTFGLVFVDRFALVYLSPFIAKDLGLNNTQVGLLVSALGITWALSGYFTTAWAEKRNKKKITFIVSVILFSVASISSGLVTGFVMLLLCRLLMGFFEGPTLPLIQSFVAKEASPHRKGLNMGILQSFGSTLFGFLLAPILLVSLATQYGWRSTFFFAGIPGLIMAFLCWKFIKPSTASIHNDDSVEPSLSFTALLQYKNIKIATILACLFMTWLNACMTFMPKYFTEIQGFTEGEMGKTMGLMGVASLIAGVLVAGLSDKFGRKKITQMFILIGIIFPLSIVFLKGSNWQIPSMFLGYFMFGAFPIVLGTIPSETVPIHSVGKAIGLIVAAGEIFGGVIIPFVCGILADKFGLELPFYVSTIAAILAFFLSFSLVENNKTI
jgi:MFS family permease